MSYPGQHRQVQTPNAQHQSPRVVYVQQAPFQQFQYAQPHVQYARQGSLPMQQQNAPPIQVVYIQSPGQGLAGQPVNSPPVMPQHVPQYQPVVQQQIQNVQPQQMRDQTNRVLQQSNQQPVSRNTNQQLPQQTTQHSISPNAEPNALQFGTIQFIQRYLKRHLLHIPTQHIFQSLGGHQNRECTITAIPDRSKPTRCNSNTFNSLSPLKPINQKLNSLVTVTQCI